MNIVKYAEYVIYMYVCELISFTI